MLHAYDLELLAPSGGCSALTAYAIYVVATTFLLGAALSYILQDWITSSRKQGRSRQAAHDTESAPSQAT